MSSQKIFFIALGLIAVLYTVTAVTGGKKSGGAGASSQPTSAPWAEQMVNSLLSSDRTRLAPNDVLQLPQLSRLSTALIPVPRGATVKLRIDPTSQTIR